MTFGDRLKLLRKEKNISQEELGDKIGVARTSVANYETNRNFPTSKVLEKISNLFNVSIDYLLGKTDIKDSGKQIDDVLNEAMIGMSAEEYEALSETKKKQIKDFAIYIKNQKEGDK